MRITQRIERLETTPPPSSLPIDLEKHLAPQLDEIRGELSAVGGSVLLLTGEHQAQEKKLKDLVLAVDEGIARVSRSERRVDATVKRARKELAALGYESAGLEAEAAELRLVDGAGSPGGALPEVSEGVAPADAPSSIRGVSAAQLRRVRGFP